MINATECDSILPVKRNSHQAFAQFCNRLKRPFRLQGNHVAASVIITCYRKSRLERYTGSVLLMHNGHGPGDIRIAVGERALREECIRKLFEDSNRHYYAGRSGSELVVESEPATDQDVYRIDLEEF